MPGWLSLLEVLGDRVWVARGSLFFSTFWIITAYYRIRTGLSLNPNSFKMDPQGGTCRDRASSSAGSFHTGHGSEIKCLLSKKIPIDHIVSVINKKRKPEIEDGCRQEEAEVPPVRALMLPVVREPGSHRPEFLRNLLIRQGKVTYGDVLNNE